MNLSFMTHWPEKMGSELAGKPTYFPAKIWQGLFQLDQLYYCEPQPLFNEAIEKGIIGSNWARENAKLHTIRKGNRWKAGYKIHFQIWTGKPYRSKVFQFAPVVEVKSVQKIEIKHTKSGVNILIDNNWIGSVANSWDCAYDRLDIMPDIFSNDGFPNVESFFKWFDKDFEGQIIHWTDLKY